MIPTPTPKEDSRKKRIELMRRPLPGEIDTPDGILPITHVAATLAEVVKRVRNRRKAVVITQKGRASAVIIDMDSYTTIRNMAAEYAQEHWADEVD